MTTSPRFFAVVPCAGVGARMGAPLPKQYLPLAGATVLAWSLRALLAAPWIEQVLLVVAPGDARAADSCAGLAHAAGARLRIAAVGGATRRDSVLAGLGALRGRAMPDPAGAGRAARSSTDHDPPGDDDWVLVHDAARPGLTRAALQRLRDGLAGDAVGGLLALPVADTVKRAGPAGTATATLSRDGLWLAQTPQMFRFGRLRDALARHAEVTDEASAIEAEGLEPLLVEGERRNFKVTTLEDLELMRQLLAGEARQAGHSGQET